MDKEKGRKAKDDGDDATGSSSLVTNATPAKKVCQMYFIVHAVECRNLQPQSDLPWRTLEISEPMYCTSNFLLFPIVVANFHTLSAEQFFEATMKFIESPKHFDL